MLGELVTVAAAFTAAPGAGEGGSSPSTGAPGVGDSKGPDRADSADDQAGIPATWRSYGRDGDGDGRKDVHNPADAIPAAARYLCAHGAATNLRGPVALQPLLALRRQRPGRGRPAALTANRPAPEGGNP
ncbi:lytic murein transglycosylase [Actinomadura spongiicola]|nr:lytic murein transglycosylase [Actinomadura spongiicola]